MEAAPLLEQRQENPAVPPRRLIYQVPSSRIAVFFLAFIIFCLALAGSLTIVPTTRLLEDILCHHHYKNNQDHDGEIDESLCKIDPIQSELAYFKGFLSTLEAIIGLAVALPYGSLADKLGRKPIFWLSMIGNASTLISTLAVLHFWKSIPVRAIFISPAFQIVGGGYNVISAVIFSMAADVESTENRGSAFFLITLGGHIGNLLGPAVSSYLMAISSPWAPLLLCLIIIPVAMSILLFVPETLRTKNHPHTNASQDKKSFFSTIKSRLQCSVIEAGGSFSMLKSPHVTLLLLTNLVYMPTILSVGQFFVQYVSKRFDWPLADTGYLLFVRGIVSIAVLLIALPVLSKLLLLRVSPSMKDLVLAKTSALFLAVGFLFLAGSHISIIISGVIIMTFGDGLSPLCRSLLTNFVDSQHTSTVYVLIGIVESISSIYAGPALAWFFTTGMRLSGPWLGLPYLWLALNADLVLIALYFVRSEATMLETEEADGDESGQNT